MKKILIAISDNFLNEVYSDFFETKNFKVINIREENDIFSTVEKERPDIVLLDVIFAEKNDYDLLKKIKNQESINKIPIILYSKVKENGYMKKAIEFELKDFILGFNNSPIDILRKVKIHLSLERSYRIPVDGKLKSVEDLVNDLGYNSLICKKCSKEMNLYLIRDLSRGYNTFKVSFICINCN